MTDTKTRSKTTPPDLARGYFESSVDPVFRSVDNTIADIERESGRHFGRDERIVVFKALVALVTETEWRASRRVNW